MGCSFSACWHKITDRFYKVERIPVNEITSGSVLCNYPFCVNLKRMSMRAPNEYCIRFRNSIYCHEMCLQRHRDMNYHKIELDYRTYYADL